MTLMKYRCWREVEGGWRLIGYEAVMSGRWHTSKTSDMANATPGTFDEVERDAYTGLTDKKRGIEIYERDLVTVKGPNVKAEETGEVIWNPRKPGYEVRVPKPYWPARFNALSMYNAATEVIGNSYEHPELAGPQR